MAKNSTASWQWPVVLLLVAGGIGGAWYLGRRTAPAGPAATAPVATPAPAAGASPAPVQHPIEEAVTGVEPTEPVEPLPLLSESDAAMLASLGAMFGLDRVQALLHPEFVIQRIVATVDNLPRRKLAPNILPVRTVGGRFATDAAGDGSAIAAANAQRYARYVEVVDAIDAKVLVGLYKRFYPLFQQAYRELGHPDGYFNDRLVEVVDHLLAAPDVAPPLAVVQPKAFYEFSDPQLESLSAGQKVLLRIGPENATKVKAKLREIRAALVGAEMPAA